jgi:hypothetical protein
MQIIIISDCYVLAIFDISIKAKLQLFIHLFIYVFIYEVIY